jgi:hypothetical protein
MPHEEHSHAGLVLTIVLKRVAQMEAYPAIIHL